jgi:hypothetical protein
VAPPSFRNTPAAGVLNTVVCVGAGLMAALGWTAFAATFTFRERYLPVDYCIPFIVLVIPLGCWALYVAQGVWLRAVPRIAWLPLAAAAIAVIASVARMSTLPDQPEYNTWSRQYGYQTRDGTWIRVTRAQFLDATNALHRVYLGVPLLIVTLAIAVIFGSRQRLGQERIPRSARPQPVRPRRRIPVPAGALIVTAITGLACAGACGALLLHRVEAYGSSGELTVLHTGRTVSALLAPGEYTIFEDCTWNYDCQPLGANGIAVSPANIGTMITDPSSDHLSVYGQPSIGELNFHVPVRETVRIELTAHRSNPVFALPSEGEEARALSGWIVLALGSLLAAAASLAGLVVLARWRLGLSRTGQPMYTFPPPQAVYPYPSDSFPLPPGGFQPPGGSWPPGTA